MSLQIFIVFHKYIFDECYVNIPPDVLYNNFTFVAVNEKIPKKYTENKYKVINEWELSIYDKSFQELGYNENSVLYHVFINNLHVYYDYVGFFQYDMLFKNNVVDYIHNTISTINNPIYFAFKLYDFNLCSYQTWNEPTTLDFVIKDYENYYNTTFNKDLQYPLYNSYILPIQTFSVIMGWIVKLYNKIYPWCIQPPNASHFGHIGGIYERIMGFAIAQQNLPFYEINISHNHKFKNISY